MLPLSSDADAAGSLVRALRRLAPELDVKRVQDYLPEGTPDPDVLEWAAQEGRVLLTRDVSTMIDFARQRIREGRAMAWADRRQQPPVSRRSSGRHPPHRRHLFGG